MDLLEIEREHHKISAKTGIRQMTCYIGLLNIDSHSNLL